MPRAIGYILPGPAAACSATPAPGTARCSGGTASRRALSVRPTMPLTLSPDQFRPTGTGLWPVTGNSAGRVRIRLG